MKEVPDDKLNVAQMMLLLRGREENIVRKEENAGYQYVLLITLIFHKALFFFWESFKHWILR